MTIASFCRDQLLACGPLALDVLAERAAVAGVTAARDPAAAVRSALAYKEVLLNDGRWATPMGLLEGRILTARRLPLHEDWSCLSADEAGDDDLLLQEPELIPRGDSCLDLALLDQAARASRLPLASGGVVQRDPYSGQWRVPKDWPGLRPAPGELLGLRVRDGQIQVEVVPVSEELRAAGRRLAEELGPLDARRRSWASGATQVVENLSAALCERMAAEPTFLTAPVPPLTECIPPLASELRLEREARVEQASRWRPQLELPTHLRDVAVRAARSSGELLGEWLDAFVARGLSALDDEDRWEDEYAKVVTLRRLR